MADEEEKGKKTQWKVGVDFAYHQEYIGEWVHRPTWKKILQDYNVDPTRRREGLRVALKHQAVYIRVYEKDESSCGHCPLSLFCLQGRHLKQVCFETYFFSVCQHCSCLGFVNENFGFHICALLREGIHRRRPFATDRREEEESSRRRVLSALGYIEDNLHKYDLDIMPVGCVDATMEDVFHEPTPPGLQHIRKMPFNPTNMPPETIPPNRQHVVDALCCTREELLLRSKPTKVERF